MNARCRSALTPRTLRLWLLVVGVGLCATPPASAQTCPGTWLPGQGISGVAGSVTAVLPLPNGGFIAVGGFQIAGASKASSIARFDPATQQWTGITSIYNFINDVLLLPDGDLLVAGRSGSGGASSLGRYRPSVNQWQPPVQGFTGAQSGLPEVRALALRPDGNILVSGSFISVNSTQLRGIGLYNPTYNTWSPFGSGVTHATAASVNAIVQLPSGDFVIGGTFSTAGGVNATNIARWNVATSTWTPLGAGVGGLVSSLSLTPDGRLLVAGAFLQAGGSPMNNIAIYDFGSSTWSGVGTGFGTPGTGSANDAVMLPGGDIIAVGLASAFPIRVTSVARYSAHTNSWAALAQPSYSLAAHLNPEVRSATLLPNGSVMISGFFTSINGVSANGIASLDLATNTFSPTNYGNGDRVTLLLATPELDLYAAGPFSSLGGVPAQGLAYFDRAANSWSGVPSAPNGAINTITRLPDGYLILGGRFASAGGLTVNNIVRYNPTAQSYSSLGPGVSHPSNPLVNDVLQLPNGDLVVGGSFNAAGSVTVSNIARYTPSTGTWSTMGSGLQQPILALALLSNGLLAACPNGLHRYFNSNNLWLPASPAGSVDLLTPLPNGDLLVAGSFGLENGWPAQRFARFNPFGNIITPITGAPLGAINEVRVHGNEAVIGGRFEAPGYIGTKYVASLNLTTGQWTFFGSDTNATVEDVAVLPNGEVVAAGSFTMAGDTVSPYLARWIVNSADFDNDGNVGTDADIEAFFACLAGDCCPSCGASDFNGDSEPGTDADIEAFFRVLAGGPC